jgi:hypothetical protein
MPSARRPRKLDAEHRGNRRNYRAWLKPVRPSRVWSAAPENLPVGRQARMGIPTRVNQLSPSNFARFMAIHSWCEHVACTGTPALLKGDLYQQSAQITTPPGLGAPKLTYFFLTNLVTLPII